MKKRSRKAIALGAALLPVIAGYFALQIYLRNELTVVNQSGATIKTLEIKLPWQTLRFDALADGARRSGAFEIKHDAHFDIRGVLADGTQFHAADGYVTNGQYGERARVEIGRDGTVTLHQGGAAR